MNNEENTYKRNHMIGIRHGESANEIRQQRGVQSDPRHDLDDTSTPFHT